MTRVANPWIAFERRGQSARVRLFCLPYAGGGALAFRPLAGKLPSFVDVCPIEIPGRGTRFQEEPETRLSSIVSAICVGIRDRLDLPFAFFGHSMGALLAFELARKIRREHGLLPARLFVSGMRAPQLPNLNEPMFTMPTPAFLEKIRKLGGTPESVWKNPEILEMMTRILRSDFEVCDTYFHTEESSLDTCAIAFGGMDDPFARIHELRAWESQVTGGFTCQTFPGGHFFINEHLDLLANSIATSLSSINGKE